MPSPRVRVAVGEIIQVRCWAQGPVEGEDPKHGRERKTG